MYLNISTYQWTVIGTLQGNGYNCRTDRLHHFEGSTNGVWNKVTQHIEWIVNTMESIGELVCHLD